MWKINIAKDHLVWPRSMIRILNTIMASVDWNRIFHRTRVLKNNIISRLDEALGHKYSNHSTAVFFLLLVFFFFGVPLKKKKVATFFSSRVLLVVSGELFYLKIRLLFLVLFRLLFINCGGVFLLNWTNDRTFHE